MEKEDSPKQQSRVRFVIMNLIRLMLVLGLTTGLLTGRTLILYLSAAGLIFTFIPSFLEKNLNVKVPAHFEITLILFIYGLFFVAEVRGLFSEFIWWGILLNMASAIALGFIGLTVLYVLYKDEKLNASPLIVAIFAFSFAVAIGSVWEIFEFTLDSLFQFNMQKSSLDTMGDLIVNSIGAFLVSLTGYFYIKNGKLGFVSTVLARIIEKNPRIFKGRGVIGTPSDKLEALIKSGEHQGLEFKSTLRTNLYTKEVDKRIEHSTLKTVAAYLNSSGGTLLIGVNDNGEILGIENDLFPTTDKLNLHFTNLIKDHIGNEFSPFINFDLIKVKDKHVLRIDCAKSNRHVFLKHSGREEFYVRNGPSSVVLAGSSLVDYIKNNFDSP